jgi:putative ABC transport system permease protein
VDLAIKDVQRHAGKFATTVVGVGLLIAIVLTMNGIYRGNIADGVWLIENTDADFWVVERGRGGPFNEPSRIAQDRYRGVAAVPGVATASPFIFYTAQRQVAGESQQFTIVGYDALGGIGGPRGIVAGRPITAAHFEIVADRKLGLAVGDTTRLGLHDYTVVGLTKGAVDVGGNPLIYMALPDAQEVLYQQDNEAIRSGRVAETRAIEARGYSRTDAERLQSSTDARTISAVLVELTPGADAAAVRAGIEQRLFLGVYTTSEERELMLTGRLAKVTATLGTFRTLLVIVSVVIMALIVYVLTMEKIKALATLKLIGAPNWIIVRLILEQSLVLAVLAFAAGYGIVAAGHTKFPRTLVFDPFDTVITFAVVFVGGVIASLFGIWRALKTPPSLALGG